MTTTKTHGCNRYFIRQVGSDSLIVDGATKEVLQSYPPLQGVICEYDLDRINEPYCPWSEYAHLNGAYEGKYDNLPAY